MFVKSPSTMENIEKTRYCKKGSIIAWVNIIQTRSMISFPRDFDERFLTLENIISDKIVLRNNKDY